MHAREYTTHQIIYIYTQPEYDLPEYEPEYVDEYRPRSNWRIVGAILALLCLLLVPMSVDAIIPSEVVVPASVLPPQTFTATVPIQYSGLQTVPAVTATGTLTIYNGSILVQSLPAGFIVESASGVEITLDKAVMIPSGNPPHYGTALVQAHAVVAGSAGNIGVLAINETYGTSLTLRNLTAFSGGADSYTTPVATQEDKNYAIALARYRLRKQVGDRLTNGTPEEIVLEYDSSLTMQWRCEFVVYRVPDGVKVMNARVVGDHVVLQVGR